MSARRPRRGGDAQPRHAWRRRAARGAVGLGIVATISVIGGCGGAPPATRTTLTLRHERDADEAFRMGRYGVAARRYERAVALARAQDDRVSVGRLLLRQGVALSALGRCSLAIVRLRESEAVRRQLADRAGVRRVQLTLGRCLAELGEASDAAKVLSDAATGASGCALVEAHAGLGAIQAGAGDRAAARRHYAAAGRVRCDQPGAKALLAYNRGRLAQRDGQGVSAASWFQRAAEGYASAQDEAGLSDALLALGQVKAASGAAAAAGDVLRRAGHAAWSAARPRRAAHAFALAAQQLDKAGRREEAGRCRALGKAALSQGAVGRDESSR